MDRGALWAIAAVHGVKRVGCNWAHNTFFFFTTQVYALVKTDWTVGFSEKKNKEKKKYVILTLFDLLILESWNQY